MPGTTGSPDVPSEDTIQRPTVAQSLLGRGCWEETPGPVMRTQVQRRGPSEKNCRENVQPHERPTDDS